MKRRQSGFTIVELIVVIVVIGILAAIGIVSYGAWREQTVVSQLESDLRNAATAMESARTFNQGGYPAAVPSTFTASENSTVSGGSRDGGKTFCIQATSTTNTNLLYKITNGNTISAGACPSEVAPTVPRFARLMGATNNPTEQHNVAWNAPVSNGGSAITQYRLRITFDSSVCVSPNTTITVPLSNIATGTGYGDYVYGTINGKFELGACDGITGVAEGKNGTVYISAINSAGTSPELAVDFYGQRHQ